MTYLKSAGDDLSSFSRFVRKADGILQKLKAASKNCTSEENEEEDDNDNRKITSKETNDDVQVKNKQIRSSPRTSRFPTFIHISAILDNINNW